MIEKSAAAEVEVGTLTHNAGLVVEAAAEPPKRAARERLSVHRLRQSIKAAPLVRPPSEPSESRSSCHSACTSRFFMRS